MWAVLWCHCSLQGSCLALMTQGWRAADQIVPRLIILMWQTWKLISCALLIYFSLYSQSPENDFTQSCLPSSLCLKKPTPWWWYLMSLNSELYMQNSQHGLGYGSACRRPWVWFPAMQTKQNKTNPKIITMANFTLHVIYHKELLFL
jgi:hypothetical protein